MNNRVVSLLVAACLLALLCACSPPMPTISTEPLSSGDGDAAVYTPTLPAPGTPMQLSDLVGEMGAVMHWSAMKNYEHTRQDVLTALFPVSDGEGHECTLTVTFDEAADVLTQATLSYADVSINILTDDTMVIRQIMVAMDEG